MTVVFIGETTRVQPVKEALDRLSAAPFTLVIDGLGRFRRSGGDIYWLGIEKNETLLKIYSQLVRELSQRGFVLETRDYKPHLTLGREVVLDETFSSDNFNRNLKPLTMEVAKISLMKSERLNGTLTYTEIAAKTL